MFENCRERQRSPSIVRTEISNIFHTYFFYIERSRVLYKCKRIIWQLSQKREKKRVEGKKEKEGKRGDREKKKEERKKRKSDRGKERGKERKEAREKKRKE